MRPLKIEYSREDDRGSLIQVNTGEWKQFNYLKIAKGKVFGRHYHKHKVELFYLVKGKIVVEVIDKKGGKTFVVGQGEGFIIEPHDFHSLRALEDTEIVELLSEPYSKEDVYND